MQRVLRASLTVVIFLTAAILAASCGPRFQPGDRARVSLSRSFPHGASMTVLLLPATVEGKQGVTSDLALTSEFSQRLLDLGCRVIDWEQARTRATSGGTTLRPENDADVLAIARSLQIDAIAKARIAYGFSPARSETRTEIQKLTRKEIRNGTHRKDTITIIEDLPTTRSYSNDESYYAISQSFDLVSVSSGEVLLAASVFADNDYNMTDELAMGIHRAIR